MWVLTLQIDIPIIFLYNLDYYYPLIDISLVSDGYFTVFAKQSHNIQGE